MRMSIRADGTSLGIIRGWRRVGFGWPSLPVWDVSTIFRTGSVLPEFGPLSLTKGNDPYTKSSRHVAPRRGRASGCGTTVRMHRQPGERLGMTAEVPARSVPGMRGPDVERKRDGARSTLVWDVLQEVLAGRAAQTGRAALDIVDVGGGTGGFAVPFAALGHHVTVVDPSPDALAAAQRRAAEMRVALTAVQGEADGLDNLAGRD